MGAKPESVRHTSRAARCLTVCITVLLATAPLSLGTAAARTTVAANSANRIIVWTACHQLVQLSDTELDAWRDRGVRGFACNVQRLPGMGAMDKFTGNTRLLAKRSYRLERTIHDSRIVERAHHRGMKMYLGFYLANAENAATPLAEWFDDAEWSTTALPAVRDVSAAAHALDFDGLALDQELYPQTDKRQTATWRWDYPGNHHSEAETRTKVRERGVELMHTMLAAFPDVEILAYFTKFPDTWDELVQEEVNDASAPFRSWVQLDLWDGLTSVDGYRRISFLNATFYKTPHLGSWDTAYTYEYNSLFALLSRRFTNWSYASSRVEESPFVWISSGTTSFEQARPPDDVSEQLDAARRWGMGRMFADYAYGELEGFDYGPYEDALRSAARAGVVDDHAPTLRLSTTAPDGDVARVEGTAADDFAVRFVRWRTDAGTTGTAELTWVAGPGDPTNGWKAWHTEWSAARVPLHAGTNTITVTVEDIKGLRSEKKVQVEG